MPRAQDSAVRGVHFVSRYTIVGTAKICRRLSSRGSTPHTSHVDCAKPLFLGPQEDDELTVKEARQAFAGAQNDLCGGNEGLEVGRAIEQVRLSGLVSHIAQPVSQTLALNCPSSRLSSPSRIRSCVADNI